MGFGFYELVEVHDTQVIRTKKCIKTNLQASLSPSLCCLLFAVKRVCQRKGLSYVFSTNKIIPFILKRKGLSYVESMSEAQKTGS